jgi:hypothetical protein
MRIHHEKMGIQRGLLSPITHIVPLISHIRSYPPFRSYLHPSSLFVVHNCTIIAEYRVKSVLTISPCRDHELTPRTAYTKYSIPQVQHTLSSASTQDCMSSHHSQELMLTFQCSYSFRRASLQDQPQPASSP